MNIIVPRTISLKTRNFVRWWDGKLMSSVSTTRVRWTYPLHSLFVVVLLSSPLSKYFQSCLYDVAHLLACMITLLQFLNLQGLQGTTPVLPLWFCSLCIHVSRSPSLSVLSALVCDLLPTRLFHGSPKAHCQKSNSVTILTSTTWRALGVFGALPALVGGHHWSLGATFLGS